MDHQQQQPSTLTPHADGKTVQDWLQSIGATETTYPASIGRARMNAPWNPEAQWNGTDTKGTFFARYGHYNEGVHGDESPENPHLYSAGNFAGEKAAGSGGGLDDQVLAAIRKVTGNPGLWPTTQDMEDLRLVKDPEGQDPVFLTRILPLVGGNPGAGEEGPAVSTPPHGKTAGGSSIAAPGGEDFVGEVVAFEPLVERLNFGFVAEADPGAVVGIEEEAHIFEAFLLGEACAPDSCWLPT